MNRYMGTKTVNATPMSRGDYNKFRGWTLPNNENGEDEGYLVEYLDGGHPNTDTHAGYVSWSPKEQFDNAYRAIDNLTFGMALEALKVGNIIYRSGWIDKGMYLFLVNGKAVQQAITDTYGDLSNPLPVSDAIYMKTATGEIVPWLASQTDLLKADWCIKV